MAQEVVRTEKQTHTLAILSLVAGILGLVGVLPLIGAVGAIITGNMARKEIVANPATYKGDELARIGVILGWVGVGLAVLGIILTVLAFLFIIPIAVFESAVGGVMLLPLLI